MATRGEGKEMGILARREREGRKERKEGKNELEKRERRKLDFQSGQAGERARWVPFAMPRLARSLSESERGTKVGHVEGLGQRP